MNTDSAPYDGGDFFKPQGGEPWSPKLVSGMNAFTRMIELLNRQVEYDDLMIHGNFSMPKNKRGKLDYDKAAWVVSNARNLNEKNPRFPELVKTCADYVTLYEAEVDSIIDLP